MAQTREYKKIDADTIVVTFPHGSMEVMSSYRVDSLTYVIGKKKSEIQEGLKMFVLDNKNQIQFESSGQMDSFIFQPAFYKTDILDDPMLIFAETGTEYSWGNVLYSVSESKVKEIGLINMTVEDTFLLNPHNIMPYASVETDGDTISINFTVEEVVYDAFGKEEKSYKGSDVKYLYFDNQLRLIEE